MAAGESISSIARAVGVDRTTIRRDREWCTANEPELGALEPQHGNQHATTHGATSQKRIAELQPDMTALILARFPWLDDIRLATLSHRMASHHSATSWLAERDGVVRNAAGEVWPVVLLVEKWGRAIEHLIAELEAENRERTQENAGLHAYMTVHAEESKP